MSKIDPRDLNRLRIIRNDMRCTKFVQHVTEDTELNEDWTLLLEAEYDQVPFEIFVCSWPAQFYAMVSLDEHGKPKIFSTGSGVLDNYWPAFHKAICQMLRPATPKVIKDLLVYSPLLTQTYGPVTVPG